MSKAGSYLKKHTEALVKDAMRPLLREWIDANLQTIVEGVVREEIARLTKGR